MIFDRTFHPDEANQAFTVGKLLETGQYTYQPEDHHGPTLYYAAAPLQKAFGHDSTATLDGTLLRCTPLIFAVATLVFGFLSLRKLLSFNALNGINVVKVPNGFNAIKALAALCFVFLLASSPIFVFFATDFIQEMLLACFTLMMFWAGVGYCCRGGRWKPGNWALLFGIAAGLAFATKETALLSFAAAFLALVSFKIAARNSSSPRTSSISGNPENPRKSRDSISNFILALAGFLLTAILFYSSFCSNWQGVYNAFVAAPLAYIHRATGSAASTGAAWHVHPWWQYFKWLFAGNLAFATYVVAGLLLGALVFVRKLELRVFLPACRKTAFIFTTAYAFILLALYAAIPYKTPWCALQMHIPLLLAATLGILNYCEASCQIGRLSYPSLEVLRRHFRTPPYWFAFMFSIMAYLMLVLMLTNSNLLLSSRIFHDPDSRDIPYNYAAASPEVKDLAATVAAAISPLPATPATHQPTNSQLTTSLPFIAVALPPEDTWPFPWHNRALEPQTGYWTDFEALRKLAESGAKPTVVIVPMEEGHLVQPLFPHLKNTKRFYMRPGVRVRVFW